MSPPQCVPHPRPGLSARYDVVVVGCGGWGLAVLKVLSDLGLRVLGIEKEDVCHNLRRYMKRMVMHSRLAYMVLDPHDDILADKGETHHPLIEELVQSYTAFARKFDLPIKTGCELIDIQGAKDTFTLTVRDLSPSSPAASCPNPAGQTFQLAARRVVLATGSYDSPNLAGIPGEQNAAVKHYIHEWEHIRDKRILFIGGGFSSADGVIALCPHNKILWVVRKSGAEVEKMLADQKTVWGQPDARLANTEILTESRVISLQDNTALVQTPCGRRTWDYDLCFMLIGHKPNQDLCARILNHNLDFDDDTFESRQRPGIYLVGALAKKHLEHIGLTDILCPDNMGERYVERIRGAMQQELCHSLAADH